MEEQIASAIEISFDPRADPNLKGQAFEYVNQLRQAPTAWQPCLSLFTQVPRRSDVVRTFSLEVVNNAINHGVVDPQGFQHLKDKFMDYYLHAYNEGPGTLGPDNPVMENKIAQTMTLLFAAMYGSGWESFFQDILNLTTGSQGATSNLPGTILYLRIINSIHDEIGDQLLSRSKGEQDRANTLKDLIRDRDVQKIAMSWQDILGRWRSTEPLIAELCLKAIGKWVSWIDISLVVNRSMLELLYQQLEMAQEINLGDRQERARDAAIDVLTETISKKMPASAKMEMITFLNLEAVVSQLIACPPLASPQSSSYDVDLAETVAKLVNATIIDIVRTLETENSDSQVWRKAEQVLAAFLPYLLRFFSDAYDEVCSTVINSMNDLLSFLRRSETNASQRAVMLLPILKAIFVKMRYDETSSWGDEDDQTDEAEFQDLRKRLGALQQAVAAADEQLYVDAVNGLVNDTFQRLRAESEQLDWRDLDLALSEMYLFGELVVKAGGLYSKSKPNSPAAERLVQMMLDMVQSSVGSFPHPAIQLQYMEIVVRYSSFFEKHAEYIQPTLENFLKFAHHSTMRVKTRSWYLLHRSVRQFRTHIGNVAGIVVQNLQDLLVIKADAVSSDDSGDMSSDEDSSVDSIFQSQLYLFEAVGCICGAKSVPNDQQVQFLQAIMQPIFSDIEQNLPQAQSSSSEQAILQIHHDLMALGTLIRGYKEWVPGVSPTSGENQIPAEIKTAFTRVSEITLLALSSLKSSFNIREAARFAFPRLIGIVGQDMMSQLPRWVDGLLTESSSRDEMALFLRLIDQVIFGFRKEILSFLDSLFTGLLQRVFSGLSAPATGTDDEVELAELKREYLNFLDMVLKHELSEVIVSSTNQPFFDTLIASIEHLAKDVTDLPTSKMAFVVLARMCSTWGGPDVVPSPGQINGHTAAPQPALEGFNHFMISRFSPLCWALPSNPSFNAKDAQTRLVLQEVASLQKTIYAKTGQEYLSWLRDKELRNMGMNDTMINDYLGKLASLDVKSFRAYFAKFISQGGRA